MASSAAVARARDACLSLGRQWRGYQSSAPPGVRFLPQSVVLTAAQPVQLAEALAKKMGGDDRERARTTAALVRTLKPQDRIFLAHALGAGLPQGEEATAVPSTSQPAESAEAEGEVAVPSNRALVMLAVSHGIPFVGFGFLDNFIMITAGESIEASFGALFTMSSMCAAGWGNLISDIAGLSLQEVIARYSYHIAKEPNLTPEQEALSITQRARQAGAMLGISLGCIIGMFPLLFFPPVSH